MLHSGFALYLNCHVVIQVNCQNTSVCASLRITQITMQACRLKTNYNYDPRTQQKETALLNTEEAASISDMRAGVIVSLNSYTASESWLDYIVALTLVPNGVLRGVNLRSLKMLNPGQGCSSSPLGSFAGGIAIILGPGAALRCSPVGLGAAVP